MTRPLTAWYLLLAWALTGCASSALQPQRVGSATTRTEPARPKVEVTTEAVPTPTTPSSPGPETPAAPLSVGPAQPSEPPPSPQSAPAASEPRPEPGAPSTGTEAPAAPPAPAARPAPRQIVLNFDNADVEIVVQAAAEIVGFNYVLAPGARGRKVTVQ